MEQLSKTLTLRLTASEYELLKREADERARPIGYLAREKIRAKLATAN